METYILRGEEIISWKKNMIEKGGSKKELDWLLLMAGGLNVNTLLALQVKTNMLIELNMKLEEIEDLWISYLESDTLLQYLVGRAPWRDFELEVTSDVLIPRPETELLIDYALEHFGKVTKGVWVDLGTGSGAIAIALAKTFPQWEGYVVECSEPALLIAKKNINKLVPNNKVEFCLGNWWDPLESIYGSINLAIANPPYIPKDKISSLEPEVRNHEPHLALCGGEDGFDCCREIIKGSVSGLSSGGWLLLEHHYDQSELAFEFMNNNGLIAIRSKKDFQGIDRFICGQKP